MRTVLVDRPSPIRPFVTCVLQVAGAIFFAKTLFPAEDDPERVLWWIMGLLFVLPLGAFALRNAQRLTWGPRVTVEDDEILTVRIPFIPFTLCPFVLVREWSGRWQDLQAVRFLPGTKARLRFEGTQRMTTWASGERDLSLFAIEAVVRTAAPPPVRARFVEPTAHLHFASTHAAALSAAALGVAVVLGALLWVLKPDFQSASSVRPLGVPILLIFMLLLLALIGRVDVWIDSRGFFLVRGRRCGFLPAETYLRDGSSTLNRGIAFEFLVVEARGLGKRIRLHMNRVVGLGLPLRQIQQDLETRRTSGFAAAG